eukprot:m.527730 g.527730  ORF g.527730 m.527730 type:complete len:116 (-) comp22013_c0_seq15:1409-1756(-)
MGEGLCIKSPWLAASSCVDAPLSAAPQPNELAVTPSPGNLSNNRRLALASCFTLANNAQFKDPYIPCAEVNVVDDACLSASVDPSTGEPTLTSAEDKKMLNPDVGREKARKDDQN